MSCDPVTRGAGSSSLPSSAATSAASGITDISATIASCFSGTLDGDSDLNAWLQALAAQACTNASGITTLTASVATNAAGIAANAAAIATNAAGIAANLTSIGSINSAITTIEDDIQDNVDAIQANAAAIAALDTRIDALEAPAGISDGIAGGAIPYWDGSAWGGIPVADISYDASGGGGIFIASPSSPDAILSLRATTDYTNIFEAQDTAGTSLAFAIPRATDVIGSYGRDFFIQEAGTPSKGFVQKDRTSGSYVRAYINNNAWAFEAY